MGVTVLKWTLHDVKINLEKNVLILAFYVVKKRLTMIPGLIVASPPTKRPNPKREKLQQIPVSTLASTHIQSFQAFSSYNLSMSTQKVPSESHMLLLIDCPVSWIVSKC